VQYSRALAVSVRLIVIAILVFSVLYPLLLGGMGQLWADHARGSLVEYGGEVVGSRLIGQQFSSSYYFHGRPSAINYDATQSGSANLSPYNPELRLRVEETLRTMQEHNQLQNKAIPVDLITESGSALDPNISVEAAELQIPRVAEATGITHERLRELIDKHTKSPLLGVFGLRRVNVLELNLSIVKELNK